MKKSNIKSTVHFIFEIGMLKKVAHEGWKLAGVRHPETVAEHALRAAQIGYILSVMEGDANPERVACMLVIHDNGEARIGDQHKIGARYSSNHDAEKAAFSDQLSGLADAISAKWGAYFTEYEGRTSKEGIVAKDADWLEMAFQAKEYVDQGYAAAWDWILNVEKALETKSARALIKEMKKTKFTDWWQGLKKMTHTKLPKKSK